jgi:hypothetical protein
MAPDRKGNSHDKKAGKATRNLPAKKLTATRADKVRGGRLTGGGGELPKET